MATAMALLRALPHNGTQTDAKDDIEGNFLRVLKHKGWASAKVAETITMTLFPRFNGIEGRIDDKVGKMRNTLMGELAPLKGVKEEATKTSQATFSLGKAVESNSTQLAALSRTVEQLSGQLISEA